LGQNHWIALELLAGSMIDPLQVGLQDMIAVESKLELNQMCLKSAKMLTCIIIIPEKEIES